MSDPTKNDQILAATEKLNSSLERLLALSAAPKEKPAEKAADVAATEKAAEAVSVTQTTQEAIDAERRAVQGRVAALEHDNAAKALEIAQYHEKRLAAEKELEALRRQNRTERAGQFGLEEFGEVARETFGVPGRYAKHLFDNFEALRRESGATYQNLHQSQSPMQLLMSGGFVQVEKQIKGPDGNIALYKNVAPLIDVNSDEALLKAYKLNDAIHCWTLLRQAKGQQNASPTAAPWYGEYRQAMEAVGKALGSTAAASWIPTGWSPLLIRYYDLERVITRYVEMYKMPRNPFMRPLLDQLATVYKVPEVQVNPESATRAAVWDPAPTNITMQLVDFATRLVWSKTVEEDSIIDLAPEMTQAVAIGWAAWEESAMLDGDTTNPHQDADVTAGGTDARTAWKGWRKHAIEQGYTLDLNTFNANTIAGLLRVMRRYAGIPKDRFVITGPIGLTFLETLTNSGGYPVMVGSADTSNSRPLIQTIDGVPFLFGSPVAVSSRFREDLNASGVFNGTTQTFHGLLWVNRKGWTYGFLTDVPEFFPFFDNQTFQTVLTMRTRRCFQPTYAIASNRTVAYGINISNS